MTTLRSHRDVRRTNHAVFWSHLTRSFQYCPHASFRRWFLTELERNPGMSLRQPIDNAQMCFVPLSSDMTSFSWLLPIFASLRESTLATWKTFALVLLSSIISESIFKKIQTNSDRRSIVVINKSLLSDFLHISFHFDAAAVNSRHLKEKYPDDIKKATNWGGTDHGPLRVRNNQLKLSLNISKKYEASYSSIKWQKHMCARCSNKNNTISYGQ